MEGIKMEVTDGWGGETEKDWGNGLKRWKNAKVGEGKKDKCGKRERQIKWAGMRDLSTLKASEICEACGL